MHASAARIPGPPPLLTIATRRPPGSGWCTSSAAVSKSSSSVSTPRHPSLAEQLVDGVVGVGERGRVRGGTARAGQRPSALERHDRLDAGNAARELRELAGVPERLEVQQDHRGVGIVLPVLQEVVAAHVGAVAE